MKKSTGSACAITLILATVFNLPESESLKTSPDGLKLIAEFEGCETTAYLCPARVWTIGLGHTNGVKAGDTATVQQIARFLIDDVKPSEKCVMDKLNGRNMPQSVFDAHVSLVFNTGCQGATYNAKARRETYLAKAAKSGDWARACHLVTDFKYAGGTVSKGLERRRAAEKKLCLSGLT